MRRRLTLQALRARIMRMAGGWYAENIYFRWRIHDKPEWAGTLWDLAFLPVALARRSVFAVTSRLELTRVELCITTRCSLHCRDCANLIPFYNSPADEDPEALIRDIDTFLGVVDRVHSFSVMGGESFLHSGIAKVVAHLVQQDRVGTVQVVTNGTVMPREDVLTVLAHKKVVVAVSNYPAEVAPRKLSILARLKERGINCIHQGIGVWKDLGGFAPRVDNSEAALRNRFEHCTFRQFHNLIDGEFHLCPRSAHGSRLGQFRNDPGDSVRFKSRPDPKQVRAEIRELCGKKYIAACRACKGGVELITPAIQLERTRSADKPRSGSIASVTVGMDIPRALRSFPILWRIGFAPSETKE
jgi:hypothetical protein